MIHCAILGTSGKGNKTPMTFEQARAAYVHRFTMEYVPDWALQPMPNGTFYAPQYRTDAEWYANTKFPPNNPLARGKRDTSCYSSNQSWPLGQSLSAPYSREELRKAWYAVDAAWSAELQKVYGKKAGDARYNRELSGATPELARLHAAFTAARKAYYGEK